MKNQAEVGEHRQERRKYKEQTQMWHEDQYRWTDNVKGHTWTYAMFMCQMVLFPKLGGHSSDFGVFMCVILEDDRSVQTTHRQLFPVFECQGKAKEESQVSRERFVTNMHFSVYFRPLVSASCDISSMTREPKLFLSFRVIVLTWQDLLLFFLFSFFF